MNAFPNGTRVFFWDQSGAVKKGTVEATARLADGSQVADVRLDGSNQLVRLPIASITRTA